MTPQEEKELAEFGAKFLSGFYDEEINRWILPEGIWNFIGRTLPPKDLVHLFFNGQYTPILAHLAKREMEKRGFVWCIDSAGKEYTANIGLEGTFQTIVNITHKNEYIALWLAIREAVKS